MRFIFLGLFDTRREWLFSLIPDENDWTLAIVVLMIMIFHIPTSYVLLRLPRCLVTKGPLGVTHPPMYISLTFWRLHRQVGKPDSSQKEVQQP
jgi:hypothetical protein